MSECNCDDPDYPQGVCFCGSAFSCPHGRGATVGVGSKCEICHLEAENKTLEAENTALRERCERAEFVAYHMIHDESPASPEEATKCVRDWWQAYTSDPTLDDACAGSAVRPDEILGYKPEAR